MINRHSALKALLASALLLCLAGCRSQSELPTYGSVGALEFTNQEGAPVTEKTLRGQTWIAAFMFTRCPTVCPALTRTMKSVQNRLGEKNANVRLVSFSVDPSNDTPEVLKKYALQYGAELQSWSFLTGDYDRVRKTAEDGFKLALSGSADPDAEHFGITHGSHLVLVDRELRIRGYYRSSEDEALDQLVHDAAELSE